MEKDLTIRLWVDESADAAGWVGVVTYAHSSGPSFVAYSAMFSDRNISAENR